MSQNIKPLGDRVLVRPLEEKEKQTKSGIIIPETNNEEKPEQGEVIAVGEGRLDDNGNRVPLSVKVGDTIIFSKYSPDEVSISDEKYLIVKEDSILAVIN